MSNTKSVLLPKGEMWWRFSGQSLSATVDDRITSSVGKPTRRPDKNIDGKKVKISSNADWIQWKSAAITFAGVAESDSSGLATDTERRNPLSYEDCERITSKLSSEYPGTKLVDIPIPDNKQRKACIVYIPNFFRNHKEMDAEMRRVRPEFIDRYTQSKGPTETKHKNKRWNTNITDKIYSRQPGVYKLHKHLKKKYEEVYQNKTQRKKTDEEKKEEKKRMETQRKKTRKEFNETKVPSDLASLEKYSKYFARVPYLRSSEIPFSQLSAFKKARDKISRMGEETLPDERRVLPDGKQGTLSQKYNLTNLCCELNFYFDDGGGIGYHGDAERNLVFGGSIGTEDRIIEWCRFYDNKPYMDPVTGKWEVWRLTLKPGDAYIMSEFAAGVTWKTERKAVTIRHRAGSLGFLHSQKVRNFRTIDENGQDASNFHSTDYSIHQDRKSTHVSDNTSAPNTLDVSSDHLLFYDEKKEYGEFSNFYKRKIAVDGKEFKNSEYYFQQMKFMGPDATPDMLEYANILSQADTSNKLKNLGKQKVIGNAQRFGHKLNGRLLTDIVEEYKEKGVRRRSGWDGVLRIRVMADALVAKFSQHRDLGRLLQSVKGRFLVEHTTRDKIWADGGDGGTGKVGTNYLGRMLTALSYAPHFDKIPVQLQRKINRDTKEENFSIVEIMRDAYNRYAESRPTLIKPSTIERDEKDEKKVTRKKKKSNSRRESSEYKVERYSNRDEKDDKLSKKKKKQYDKGEYKPKNVDTKLVLVDDVKNLIPTMDKYGVAVIKLDVDTKELKKALRETKFYNTANDVLKDEHKVDEPTEEEIRDPSKWKKRKTGDDAQGMIHQYGTPVHILIQSNPTLRGAMEAMYGSNLKYLPNRLRVTRKFKNNADSLHIEAHKLFEPDENGNIRLIPGDIACTVGLSGRRRFGFWYMGPDENGNYPDLKPLKELVCKPNSWENKKNFTKPTPEFMHQHYPGRRRMVNVTCDEPHLILWRESNPHEIANSPALSLFISPVEKFNDTKIKYVTSFQPKEYVGLTYHESNLLGLCYNMGGFEWPSGKKLYQFCHVQAYGHYIPMIRKEYKVNGKFQQKLVTTGTVDQHTEEYQRRLRELNIELPSIAFKKETPNFVVDITKYPIQILKDYGFIKT